MGVIKALEKSAREQRRAQIFARAVTNGVPSERDLLLNYSVGEFYNEMSLFIEENEKRKEEIEKMKKKK